MKTVGITGGIGSGKSVVCKILKLLNYPIYDTDSKAKILMNTSPVIKSKLTSIIGDCAYIGDKTNPTQISSFIFSSETNLKRLNSIVHPVVCEDFNKWRENQSSEIVFVESAILYESGLNNMVDEVWCVVADKKERIERVMLRNGLSEQEVISRINSQMSDEDRMALADYIIDNTGRVSLLKQIIKILGDV